MHSYGGAFVECSLQHPSDVEIVQLVFRINEVRNFQTLQSIECFILFFLQGALISACRDNYIHLWNLRQKKPVIANSLRFVKEK
jgi:syntaxin-binding protein 5